MKIRCVLLSAITACAVLFATAMPAVAATQVIDIEWKDGNRERVLPLKVRLPDGADSVPLVIFSHGLGGSREGGKAWGEHWSANGYLVIHLQHPGSDDALWKGPGEGAPKQRLARGATAEQLLGRVDDVRFVLDEISRLRTKADAPAWIKRADLTRIAMTGHSFGALTTMALAGVRYPGPIKTLAEPRIKAFIAFSPSVQGLKRSWPERYGEMARPFLSVTGTIDGDVMSTGSNAKNRAALFDAQPVGDKYRVIFEGGDHAVFGGGNWRDGAWMSAVTGDSKNVTDAATAAIIREHTQRITLQFLDAYLRGDVKAKAWLGNDAVKSLGNAGEWSAK
jgi:dienelactone hydrolase